MVYWEVPCELFHDWIFVNLNCDTVSFESHIAPMKKQLAGIDLDDLCCGRQH